MNSMSRRLIVLAVLLAILGIWQLKTRAQQDDVVPHAVLAKPGTRFKFEVIESFDAKYVGDTPGHLGRAGGVEHIRPRVALGDGVFRGEKKVGMITSVLWTRVQGALTVEFDPTPGTRISVGDEVWLDLNPATADSEK